MSTFHSLARISIALTVLLTTGRAQANPFADAIPMGGYTPGLNVTSGFDVPEHALGMPGLSNGTTPTDNGDLTPFNGSFLAEHLVQIGDGGELIAYFNDPVEDDPGNPFGIDLLVFGNAFFFQPELFGDSAEDVFADPARIEVSEDGSLYVEITGVVADDLFPTSAYLDSPGPFTSGGTVLSDFTKPVDPSIDWFGKNFSEIVALYDGSGGGTGVDLAETGLAEIHYVRITPIGGVTVEIDAFADVAAVQLPEPSAVVLLALASLALRGRQTRRP